MQTQYQSLVELAERVDALSKAKRDWKVPTTKLRMTQDAELRVDGGDAMRVDTHAHRQIGTRLGIPAAYYDKMLSDAPDLLAHNVNTWFDTAPEVRMVRSLEGRVRAFLSDRYQRIDNEHILRSMMPVLEEVARDHPDLKLASCALTDAKMYLKFTCESVQGEVRVGDICEAGFECRNGEIGNSRFEVAPFVNRLVCTNGMRLNVGGLKRAHVGGRTDMSEDDYELLSDEALKADDTALMLKARDVVRGLLTKDSFQKVLDRFRAAADDKITGYVPGVVEELANKFGMNSDEQASVLEHLIQAGDLTRWGIANAVTRTAQDLESYDRNDEFEGIGGKIIDLSTTDWSRIATKKVAA